MTPITTSFLLGSPAKQSNWCDYITDSEDLTSSFHLYIVDDFIILNLTKGGDELESYFDVLPLFKYVICQLTFALIPDSKLLMSQSTGTGFLLYSLCPVGETV